MLVLQDSTTLAQKLKWIYDNAKTDFVRVDADVIVNRYFTEDFVRMNMARNYWWVQFMTFGWFKLEPIYSGVHYISKKALPTLREEVGKFMHDERPETRMWRLDQFYNPRRCMSASQIVGIHGYAVDDLERVKETKRQRGQYEQYDWEMVDKLEELR